MQQETITSLFLSILIVLLLWWQRIYSQKYNKQQLHDKIIMSLLAYPVHHYSMAHMLERCLAIIFSTSGRGYLPKGAIFLQENSVLKLIAQRGLFDTLVENNTLILRNNSVFGDSFDASQFQFITAKEDSANKAHYIVPLLMHDKLIGVLTLYTEADYQSNDKDIEFIKLLGRTISSLIERKQIADESRLCHRVVDYSQQAIFITDADNRIIRCNQSCEQITGYSRDELLGKNPSIFKSNYHDDDFYKELWQTVEEEGFWQGEIWNKRKNGTLYPEWLTISDIKDGDNEVAQYLAIFTDLTNTKKAEKDIHQLAFYDGLTSLPNRTLFNQQIQQSITQAKEQNTRFALLCLDVDNFKKVNDSLGHEAGDKLLQILTTRVTHAMSKNSTIARIGGDEFAIILHDLNEDSNEVIPCARELLDCLSEPVQLDAHEIITTVSIGISYYPNDSEIAADLMRYADTAMYQAKELGSNSYQFYTDKFNQQALRKIYLESGLRQALKNNDFMVYLQPQLDLETQLMTGAEALLRVRKGELSNISPAEYIPVAEELGLIVEIGDWVFCEVCRLLNYWHDNNLIPDNFKRIAINISPMQFKRHDFVEKMQMCLKKTGVPVQHLEIELTESSLQESNNSVIKKLFAIKAMGINIAIDDFGTGYSSLSRLKEFPIDLLKIDRSFVNDLSQNQSDMAIVKAIVNMAQAINIKTLAEGVETEAQVDILKALNCNYSQGFLHSKPIDSLAFEKKLINAEESQNSIEEGVMNA
ncbi:MAG: EAL domain-containing protein [Methylococcaceae bacterium]|nr:EAL domain-containing protein [Methylococcaceae bacterium]